MSDVPDWDEKMIKLLKNKYKDWRDPSRTYMVPCVFPCIKRKLNDGEKTEKMFFELLQGFGESCSQRMFVVHSNDLAELISEWNGKSNRREEKWRIGEHDFVVIHHQLGIIFFQVKAADSTRGKFVDAAEQIMKDKKALLAFIVKNIQGKMKKKIGRELLAIFPGFVVMPNCPRPDGSVVNPPTGVFKENCESVEAFSKWWDENVKRPTVIHQKLFEVFVMCFVGMSLSTPHTLSESIDEDKWAVKISAKRPLSVVRPKSRRRLVELLAEMKNMFEAD